MGSTIHALAQHCHMCSIKHARTNTATATPTQTTCVDAAAPTPVAGAPLLCQPSLAGAGAFLEGQEAGCFWAAWEACQLGEWGGAWDAAVRLYPSLCPWTTWSRFRPCGLLQHARRSLLGPASARSELAHQGDWCLPGGQSVNIPLPREGSSAVPTCVWIQHKPVSLHYSGGG